MNINVLQIIHNDIKPLAKLALPLAVISLVGACIGFFETVFLAHFSHEAMAAGAIVSWLFGLFIVIIFGILSGINVLVAHQHGAKDKNTISLIIRDGLLLAIILTIPSVFLFWNIGSLLLFFGQDSSLIILTESYLHVLVWGLLPAFVVVTFISFLIGLGHTRQVFYVTVCSVILTLFFSFIFIFGIGGLPRLGIAGSSLGIAISYWIIMFFLIIFFLIKRDYHIYFANIFYISMPIYALEILKIGLPIGLMYCFEIGFFFVLTLIVGSISLQLLAANQIVLQYFGILMSIIFGIAQAVTVRMGHLLGAKDIVSAKKVKNAGIILSLIFITICAVVYLLFPKVLISMDFDVNNPQNELTVKLAERLFIIGALFQFFDGTRVALFGALRALGDTKFTLIISVFSFWCIALPLGYFLRIRFNLGGEGLWIGMVFGSLISTLILHWRFNSRFYMSFEKFYNRC